MNLNIMMKEMVKGRRRQGHVRDGRGPRPLRARCLARIEEGPEPASSSSSSRTSSTTRPPGSRTWCSRRRASPRRTGCSRTPIAACPARAQGGGAPRSRPARTGRSSARSLGRLAYPMPDYPEPRRGLRRAGVGLADKFAGHQPRPASRSRRAACSGPVPRRRPPGHADAAPGGAADRQGACSRRPATARQRRADGRPNTRWCSPPGARCTTTTPATQTRRVGRRDGPPTGQLRPRCTAKDARKRGVTRPGRPAARAGHGRAAATSQARVEHHAADQRPGCVWMPLPLPGVEHEPADQRRRRHRHHADRGVQGLRGEGGRGDPGGRGVDDFSRPPPRRAARRRRSAARGSPSPARGAGRRPARRRLRPRRRSPPGEWPRRAAGR